MTAREFTRRRLLETTALAGFFGFGRGGAILPAAPTLTGINLSPSSPTFTGGAPSGTAIGTFSVAMASGSFTGSISLTGTDATSFQVAGPSGGIYTLETNGIVSTGSYSFNIVATQSGAINSPTTLPVTATGVAPGGQITTMTLVNTSGSTQASGFVTPLFGQSFKEGDIPAVLVTTGTVTSGSNQVTGLASTTGVTTGQVVGIDQFTPGTTITNLSGSTITLSTNAVASASGATVIVAGVPLFKAGATVQPFSWGLQRFYPDGSLCWATFMLRCSSSVLGNSTLAVGIYPGGTAPTPSSARTLTELYALGVALNVTGLGTAFGLNGSYSSLVANDANNHGAAAFIDGDAGKGWRIDADFESGGAAHGQLGAFHYVISLTDGSGNFGGLRHMGRIQQPWYNYDTPAKNWRVFSAITLTCSADSSTQLISGVPGAQSWDAWPFNAHTFTGTAGNATFSTGTLSNFYQGAEDYQVVPGYVTVTGGAMDSALNGTTLYFITIYPAATNFTIALYSDAQGSTIAAAGDATGTMSFNPVPVCLALGDTMTAAAKAGSANGIGGTMRFIKAGGSYMADATVRTQYNNAYLLSTGLIPPFGISLPNVTDKNATWAATYDWHPVSTAYLLSSIGNTGADQSIAMIPGQTVRHFFVQSAGGEQVVRTIGLVGGFGGCGFRDHATRGLVNFDTASYVGMPAPSTAQRTTLFWQKGNGSGFTLPPKYNTNMVWYEQNYSHKPSFNYYPALVFGNPWDLDFQIEAANFGPLTLSPAQGPGWRNWSFGSPVNLSGVNCVTVYGGSTVERGCAWSSRERQYAATLVHPTHYDGTQVGTYTIQGANNDADTPYTLMSTSTGIFNSYWQSSHGWAQNNNTVGRAGDQGINGFVEQYFVLMMCFACIGNRQRVNAQNWVLERAKWWLYTQSTWGPNAGWTFYSTKSHNSRVPLIANNTGVAITSDDEFAMPPQACWDWISWSPGSSPAFTVEPPSGGVDAGFTLTNGCKFIWGDKVKPGTGFTMNTVYQAANVSGHSFDLEPWGGGSVIPPDLAPAVTSCTWSPAYPQNTITSASWAAGQVTFGTTTAHNVPVGASFTIAAMYPYAYNGTYVAALGTTGSTLVAALASNPGTVITLGHLSAASPLLTMATASPHNILVPTEIVVSGFTPTVFNGRWNSEAGTAGTTLVLGGNANNGTPVGPGSVAAANLSPVTKAGTISGTALTFSGGGGIGCVVTGSGVTAGTVILSGSSPNWVVNNVQSVSTTLTVSPPTNPSILGTATLYDTCNGNSNYYGTNNTGQCPWVLPTVFPAPSTGKTLGDYADTETYLAYGFANFNYAIAALTRAGVSFSPDLVTNVLGDAVMRMANKPVQPDWKNDPTYYYQDNFA